MKEKLEFQTFVALNEHMKNVETNVLISVKTCLKYLKKWNEEFGTYNAICQIRVKSIAVREIGIDSYWNNEESSSTYRIMQNNIHVPLWDTCVPFEGSAGVDAPHCKNNWCRLYPLSGERGYKHPTVRITEVDYTAEGWAGVDARYCKNKRWRLRL